MITHLTDIDWAIEYLRGRADGINLLRPLIEQGVLATSVVVYGELYEGVLGDPNTEQRLRNLESFLRGVPVLGVDKSVGETYAKLRLELRTKGTLLADNDLWIAATALRHDLILLARDGHFDRIEGLKRV